MLRDLLKSLKLALAGGNEAPGSPQGDDLRLARPLALPDFPVRGSAMSRRNFLGRVMAGAAGAAIASTVDLDQLLWMPGEKTIFLLPPPVLVPEAFSPNVLLTDDWITREMLHILTNNLTFAKRISRAYDKRQLRPGDTIHVPLPQRFVGKVDA